MNNFDEYIRQGEPSQKEKAQIWQTAIGLQDVDGLKPSEYLIANAKENIEGDITISEVKNRIDAYYKTQSNRQSDADARTEEADKVSARITEILSEKTFSFSPAEYINIHRRLFGGIYKFAGKLRDYNITKSEWVLNGETVFYASADSLNETLEYDFKGEKTFIYKGLNTQQIVEHIAHFIAYLWQIHIFGEGNTRTTAVFLIKYLHKLGFKNVNNTLFAQHSWYFRNALVRANYEDLSRGIYKTEKYLVRFLSNLLLGENNELKNRMLHINFKEQNLHLTENPDSQNVGENSNERFGVNDEKLGVNDEKLGVNDKRFGVKLGVNVGEMSEKCRRNVGEMSERQKQIIKLISENNTISAKQISAQIKISDRTIERDIKKMIELKIIERIGADRGGSWQIMV